MTARMTATAASLCQVREVYIKSRVTYSNSSSRPELSFAKQEPKPGHMMGTAHSSILRTKPSGNEIFNRTVWKDIFHIHFHVAHRANWTGSWRDHPITNNKLIHNVLYQTR